MIRVENLCKTYIIKGRRHTVVDNVSATFPRGVSVALMGRNGAGKSTLMSLIAGTLEPDSGDIETRGTVSWPVGYKGSFHRELSGAQNVRFIARVYGVDSDELCEFVEDFAELGDHFHLPVRSYSSGMKSRLSFGLSMGIHFDTYLIDEVTSVGDAAFKTKSSEVFLDRMRSSGAVLVSHSTGKMRKLCTAGAVLEDGQLYWYDDIEDAIAHHQENMYARHGRELEDEDEDDD